MVREIQLNWIEGERESSLSSNWPEKRTRTTGQFDVGPIIFNGSHSLVGIGAPACLLVCCEVVVCWSYPLSGDADSASLWPSLSLMSGELQRRRRLKCVRAKKISALSRWLKDGSLPLPLFLWHAIRRLYSLSLCTETHSLISGVSCINFNR